MIYSRYYRNGGRYGELYEAGDQGLFSEAAEPTAPEQDQRAGHCGGLRHNRNSFYYHFHDIPSLLGEIITEQTEQLIQAYPSISSLDECFHMAFQFALENKRAVMHIYHSVNRDMFTQSMLRLCGYAVSTYIATAFPDDLMRESDRQIVIRFMKCQLFGMCIDWIDRGMTDAAYDDLHRMLELSRDVPELVIRRSRESR